MHCLLPLNRFELPHSTHVMPLAACFAYITFVLALLLLKTQLCAQWGVIWILIILCSRTKSLCATPDDANLAGKQERSNLVGVLLHWFSAMLHTLSRFPPEIINYNYFIKSRRYYFYHFITFLCHLPISISRPSIPPPPPPPPSLLT